MRVAAYQSYRDSESQWLGQVPSHWTTLKLSRLVDPRRAITYGIVQAGPDIDGGVPYIRPADMSDEAGVRDIEGLLRTSQEIATAYRRSTVRAGDLVCSIGPSFGKVMVVPPALEGANLTQGTARIAVNSEAFARYVFWTLRARPAISQWESSVGGATFGALNLEPLARTLVCCPPKSEQVAIAAFLDRETGKIDALVEAQWRLIELLREKRQAVTSLAVTKGLDATAPIKNAGVEWLGAVPAHWEVTRLANVFREVAEPGDDSLPVLSVSIHNGVSDDEAEPDQAERKVTRSEDRTKYKRVQPNDLVYNMMRAWQGGFGTVQVVGAVSPAYVVARPTRPEIARFIELLLRTPKAVEEMRRRSRGVTDFRLRLYWDEFKDMSVAIPDHDEIRRILSFVADGSGRWGQLSSEAEAAITLLQERRSALISAAVTGKIDVRGLLPEQAEAA